MDVEFELVKAIMGMKFKCGVCGKTHDPKKRGWIKCYELILDRLSRDIYGVFDYVIPFPTFVRKGQKAKEIVEKYSFPSVWFFKHDFELAIMPKVILERRRRFIEYYNAWLQFIKEKIEKLPDVTPNVSVVERGNYREITRILVHGEEFSSIYLRLVFTPPSGKWSDSENDGKWFKALNHSFYQITPDLEYAVIQERRSEYYKKQIRSLKKKVYLISSNGGWVEIHPSYMHAPIEKTLEKYVGEMN